MSLKAKVEAMIYAAEEPITLEQLAVLLKDMVLAELAAARENAAMVQAMEQAGEPTGGTPCESTFLPELDSSLDSSDEEPNDLEAGPLMPQSAAPEAEQAEDAQESAPSSEDDEPFFATAAEAVPATAIASGAEIPEAAAPEPAPQDSASVAASVSGPDATARRRQPKKSEEEIAEDKAVRARLREILAELVADYAGEERGMEIRQIAGGFRMATKPQHHDVVRAFAKSLKPPIRLSLAALETLAVIAYKQPVTAPEIADIRGVESASVLGTLLDRKLITTAGRKQVIGRPMQYKTSKDFLLRFGLNDVNELPSMEEFSQLASDATIEVSPTEAHTPSLFAADVPAAGIAELADAGDQEEQSPATQPETPQAAATQASASQPQSEAEPCNEPETGNNPGQ